MNSELSDQIIEGDCLEVCSKMPDNSVDLIYVDPPFDVGTDYKTRDGRVAFVDKMSADSLANYLYPRIFQFQRIMKPDGLFYLHGDHHSIHYLKVACDRIFGIRNFRNEIIWHFNSAPRKENDFGKRHNAILRYSKTDSYKFIPEREPYSLSAPRGYEKEKYYHPDGKVIDDVWHFPILGQNDKSERVGYPTQKPERLIERIVRTSSYEGNVVLDPCCGSGTTCVVARKLNRRYIGIDNSPIAVEFARKRLGQML